MSEMQKTKFSVVIIGSGIAGLFAALKISENSNVDNGILLVTKSKLGESNSRYAQGGIVGVLPENILDSTKLHVDDTIKAGAGLSDLDVATFISEHSANAIRDLVDYGVKFDKDTSKDFAMTLEGAHSVKRILHAGGDATGQNIELVLSSLVQNNPKITIYEETSAVELLTDSDSKTRGAILYNKDRNEYEIVYSSAVVLATGGFGQVYSNTTNPSIATGDGIAIAYKADALIQDMEFVQFHPTALAANGDDTRFLISESVRGEGARLRNKNGELFSFKYDEQGDLAPRDVVTRSIYFEMNETNTEKVYLDTSMIPEEKINRRFPNISKACAEKGINMVSDHIPVSPAAHYAMGGINISVDGKTSIPGLYAIGEVSCTSLHGANRLASNSLLECVVLSTELSRSLADINLEIDDSSDVLIQELVDNYNQPVHSSEKDVEELIKELKDLMWKNAGIVRDSNRLGLALEGVCKLKEVFSNETKCANYREYELRNLLIVAELIVKSALARKESRGGHYREDYLETSANAYHSYMRKRDQIKEIKRGLDNNAVSFA